MAISVGSGDTLQILPQVLRAERRVGTRFDVEPVGGSMATSVGSGDTPRIKVPEVERRVRTHFDAEPNGYWWISNRWAFVRNDKNPDYKGPEWKRYFYNLVYVPAKSYWEEGYNQEKFEGESKKKHIYAILGISSIAVLFSTLGYIFYIQRISVKM